MHSEKIALACLVGIALLTLLTLQKIQRKLRRLRDQIPNVKQGEILIGDSANRLYAGNLTSNSKTINVTPGDGTINIEAASPFLPASSITSNSNTLLLVPSANGKTLNLEVALPWSPADITSTGGIFTHLRCRFYLSQLQAP